MNFHLNKYGVACIVIPLCIVLYSGVCYSMNSRIQFTAESSRHYYPRIDTAAGLSSNKTAKENDDAKGQEIIEKYISALGGRIYLKKISDRTIYLRGEVQGRRVSMTIYQKSPDKMKEEISLGPVRQTIVFDGTEGASEIGGRSLEIKGHELEKLKFESMPDFPSNIDSMGIKIEYAGTEKINGEEADKIKMILPGGTSLIQFYDSSSHLKVRELSSISVTEGNYTQQTDYGDYRAVEGIKYPFTLKQKLGRHFSVFKVDSIKINSGLKDDMFDLP